MEMEDQPESILPDDTKRKMIRAHIHEETFPEKACRLVYEYVKPRLEKTDKHVTFGTDEVYVVWFAKTLQNWKALVSTTLPDGMYYEVTYNGDKEETYIDAYKKFDNVCVFDPTTREKRVERIMSPKHPQNVPNSYR